MGLIIESDGVTVSSAAPLPTNLPDNADTAGFVTDSNESDDGLIDAAGRAVYMTEATADYRKRIGLDTLLATYMFSGSVVDTSSAPSIVSTMTVTQGTPAGFLVLNAGNSVASGAHARMTTQQMWQTQPGAGLSVRMNAMFAFTPVANNVCEWGRFLATAVAVPTDGQFFRYTAAGVLECVVCFNSSEASIAVTATGSAARIAAVNARLAALVTHDYAIDVYSDQVVFWIDNQRVATVPTPPGVAFVDSSVGLPVTARCYNAAGTGSAQQMRIAGIQVLLQDVNSTRRIDQQQIASGLSTMQWPPNGATVGPLVLCGNTAAPTARTLSNTATPDATHSTLNGDFLVTMASLTAQTDYILNVFQNPAAGANAGGRILMISGIHFDGELTGAANSTTIQNYELFLGVGATQVTLVTVADAAGAVKCARRLPLARISTPASAAIGYAFNVDAKFDGHIAVNPGEYVHLILKPTLYTSVASQTLRYGLRIDGVWY
jgi:hypothetical protein